MPVITVTMSTADLRNRFSPQLGNAANLQPLQLAVTNRLNNQHMGVNVNNVTAEFFGSELTPGSGQGSAIKFTITSTGDLTGEQVKAALR
jgi:hypothetical protein